MGERSEREQCCLLDLGPAFSHFPCYTQGNWALPVLIPRCVGLCTFLDPLGLSNELSCEAGSFSHCCNPYKFFQSGVLRFYSPVLEPWVAWSRSPVFPPSLSTHKRGTTRSTSQHLIQSASCSHATSHCLAVGPLCPGWPSPPLLLVWMNVSSLTPWLSHFHTVRFSGSLVVFCF